MRTRTGRPAFAMVRLCNMAWYRQEMRRLAVLLVVASAPAAASPRTVVGEVTAAKAHWTADGSRIVTEATVHTSDGDVVVSQLGGSVGGLGMRTFPGPEPLVVGMKVSVAAHDALDLARRSHVVVDDVHVTDLPIGFVRTGPTQAGNSLYWESGCVLVTPDADGTKEVVGDNEFAAISDAIAEWNDNVSSCSYMHIVEETPVASEVGNDRRNMIKFRDATWCRPAIKDDPARCYSPQAAGITTAIFVDDASSDRDGAIVDADVELNGHDFALADNGQSTGTQTCRSEIRNTLTHELGHLLGLEHPCLAAGDPNRTDGDGKPVPACSSVAPAMCQVAATSCAGVTCGAGFVCIDTCDPLDPDGPGCGACPVTCASKIAEATMFNFQDCDEHKKESLSADDIDAICKVYPKANDPGECGPVGNGNGGCCDSSTAPHPATLLIGLVVVVLLRRKNSHAQ